MKVAESCPTLCNPIDYTVHGILQARILKWVEPFSSPGDLLNPGIEPRCLALQADSLLSEPPGKRYVAHKKQALEPYVHESEQTPGDGEGQGSLACCSPWGHKESDTTE